MKWIVAAPFNIPNEMGKVHWRDAKTKLPISVGVAFTKIKTSSHNSVEWLDETPSIAGSELYSSMVWVESWEKNNNALPNGVNPHAYRLGFLEGIKYAYQPISESSQDELWADYISEKLELKYHTSWDWLMPVVEKISKLGFHVSIHVNKVACSSFIEETVNPENRLYSTNWSTPLLAAYNAVTQFINWYNQNKQP